MSITNNHLIDKNDKPESCSSLALAKKNCLLKSSKETIVSLLDCQKIGYISYLLSEIVPNFLIMILL